MYPTPVNQNMMTRLKTVASSQKERAMRYEPHHPYTKKEKTRVMICAHSYWIEGDLYLLAGSRLSDSVNVKAKDFMPLTNVKIIDPKANRTLYDLPFAIINREDIVMIFPVEDSSKGISDEEGGPTEIFP